MLTIMQIDGTFSHDERSKGIEACFKSYLIKHIREHKYRGYTRWPEDVNIVFERVNKILFSTRENNIHIFKLPCNVLFIAWSEQSNREHRNPTGKHTRYIFFHLFTSENMGDTSVLVYGKTPITI